MVFQTNGTTEAMRITAGQNVGIGTSSPAVPLHVFTTGSNIARFARDLATDSVFTVGADNDGTILESSGVNVMRFFTNATERMRITSGGEVIVGGSTSGGADLTVDGSGGRIACLDTNGGIYFGTTPSGGFSTNGAIARAALSNYHVSGSGAGDLCIAPDGGRNILFGSATSSGIGCSLAVRIDASGRVSQPLQPAFACRNFSNTNTGVKVFSSVPLNTGGHYNNSNGRFTAPIAGNYYISASYLVNAGYINIQFGLRVNGSDWAELKTGDPDGVNSVSWSGIIPLAANDYVDLNCVSGGAGINTGSAFGQFSGQLVS
jgi:hypothetical protein